VSRCKICGCLGWFTHISEAGVCTNCDHMLSLEIAQRSRRIEDCLRSADQTVNPGSKIARLDETLCQLEALSKYEERGIRTIEGSPAAMSDDVRRRKDEVVAASAQADVQETMARIQSIALPERKIDLYGALLVRLSEYRRRMSRGEKVAELEDGVREAVRRIRLNVPMDRARLAEARGQKEKALEAYREALTFLRSNDPERAALSRHIPEIERRIQALGGPPAA
jgi:hypothetical protein